MNGVALTLTRITIVGALALVSLAAIADESQEEGLHIAPQSLSTALREFSEQTGLQVGYAAELTEGKSTAGVEGVNDPALALDTLLAHSGLTHTFVNEQTVVIQETEVVTSDDAGGDSDSGNGRTVGETPVPEIMAQVPETDKGHRRNSSSFQANSNDRFLEGGSPAIEEVIVTAQKRAERLQDVPISISVLDGEVLDRSSYSTVNEVLRTIPGIASFESGQGAGMSKFSVRGVASNDSTVNGSATVGYYLDEIPFAFVRFPMSPDVNAYDLERVEVLRGPQGTLYGANALNGVVRVMTKDANLTKTELSARTTISSTESGGENYRADAALSMPLIPGKLGVRVVAGYADYSGWIDQPATGLKNINDMTQKNLRLKVNAAPAENVDVEFLTWFSRDDRGSHSSSLDDLTSPTAFPETIGSELDAFGLTLTYEAPAFSILSSTSYLDFYGDSLFDFPAGLDQLVTAYAGKLMSEEVRVSSSSEGPWRWSVGGMYRDEEDSFLQDLIRNAVPGLTGISNNIFKSASFAIYGEVSRLFFDNKLELTGGLRYFEDKTYSNETSSINPLDTPFGKQEDKFDGVTPRVILSFRPSERATYYASYSEGFRSGFAQQGLVIRASQGLIPAVDPDRLTNYEIGTKSNLFDARLTYDLAIYYIDWEDGVQVLAVTIPNTTAIVNAAVNSKGIDGFGVDFATGLKLSERLQVDATFSWNDLAFAEDVFSGTTRIFPEGSRPVSSPKMNAGAGFSYLLPSMAGYSTQFTGSASYTTEMLGPFVGGVQTRGDNFLVARASLNVTSPSGWSAMIFADNLTNEDGRIRAAPSGAVGVSDRLRPRTFGVQLDYRF